MNFSLGCDTAGFEWLLKRHSLEFEWHSCSTKILPDKGHSPAMKRIQKNLATLGESVMATIFTKQTKRNALKYESLARFFFKWFRSRLLPNSDDRVGGFPLG